ncbi:unnamed protein product [Ceutorhynchus assimilis]|uniref:Uncharacterized protein n=1 Tax=Ceutorhynchus assimilis TaxID=467358 RepID=A0A9N9MPW5_9CUCU|nr:unnamed protein product [Ceutorhynchus assimilis]
MENNLKFGFILLYVISTVSSTTWVIQGPRALFGLAGSASASASSPSTTASYIADLRRKDSKAAQLQEEKSLVGLEPLSEEVNKSNEEANNNEASPSLLQKKIGKVLAKLRLIAQIKNAYHYKPEEHEHESNITLTSQENTTEENQTESKANIQQIPSAAYGVPLNDEDQPEKIQIEINDKLENDFKHESDKIKEPNRLSTIGVFFAEILGSIVGLTYGAFAQITSANQNPVTASSSEGL